LGHRTNLEAGRWHFGRQKAIESFEQACSDHYAPSCFNAGIMSDMDLEWRIAEASAGAHDPEDIALSSRSLHAKPNSSSNSRAVTFHAFEFQGPTTYSNSAKQRIQGIILSERRVSSAFGEVGLFLVLAGARLLP